MKGCTRFFDTVLMRPEGQLSGLFFPEKGSAMKAIRMWNRDYKIIDELHNGIYSTGQLARLYFPSRKKASERLKLLSKGGHIKRLQKPILNMRGKPEFIYFSSKKPFRKNYMQLNHDLQITEFKVNLLLWTRTHSDFSGFFYYTSQLPKIYDGLFMPDGVFIVGHEGKKLLHFLEIDLGTESLAGKSYGFADKLGIYSDYFDSGKYKDDFRWLDYAFKGFRLVILFRSKKRLDNFRILAEKKQANYVFLLTTEQLKPDIFQKDIWTTFNNEKSRLF